MTLQNHDVGHEKSHYENILFVIKIIIKIINTNILIIITLTNLQLNVTLDPATATSAFSGVVVITGEAVVGFLEFDYDDDVIMTPMIVILIMIFKTLVMV